VENQNPVLDMDSSSSSAIDYLKIKNSVSSLISH
jgi:hypothetical protein